MALTASMAKSTEQRPSGGSVRQVTDTTQVNQSSKGFKKWKEIGAKGLKTFMTGMAQSQQRQGNAAYYHSGAAASNSQDYGSTS